MGKQAPRSSKGATKKKRPAADTPAENDPLVTDDRFTAASWDPRFSRVPKRARRAIADPRFSTKLRTDPAFRDKFTAVDRFGRAKKKPKLPNAIQQLAADDEKSFIDPTVQDDAERPDPPTTDGAEVDADYPADEAYEPSSEEDVDIPARAFGLGSADSDDSGSDVSVFSDEEVDDEVDRAVEEIPRGKATHRLAVVGLDWSITRAVDIFASLSCFCPTGKRIVSVEVHPSKFGLERLTVEARLGPQVIAADDLRVVREAQNKPRSTFKTSNDDIVSDDDDAHNGEEDFDSSMNDEGDEDSNSSDEGEDLADGQMNEKQRQQQIALRRYEEERLKYYYAVVTFDSVKTADAIYEQCDGVEYGQTGRGFDLRFIPDDMKIETKPRERAGGIPEGYAPPNVNPSSLNNSTVKLSWDADDPDRIILKKKAFGQHDIDEHNLKAYLASSSDEDEEGKPSKKELEEKRNLLLGGGNEEGSDENNVDLEVTFEPGMLEKGEEIVKRKMEKDEQEDETPWEARMRRLKERKQDKRKQRREALAAKDRDSNEDSSSDVEDTGEVSIDENPSFSDPFFSVDRNLEEEEEKERTKHKKKGKQRFTSDKKDEEETSADEEERRRVAELELLAMDDGRGKVKTMREKLAEADSDEEEDHRQRKKGKRARGKRRWQKEKQEKEQMEKGSNVDTDDARFQGVFNSHLFAIDPTHPKYKDDDTTRGIMKEKGRRTRQQTENMGVVRGAQSGSDNHMNGTADRKESKGQSAPGSAQTELRQLAARLKARAKGKKLRKGTK